ncbi:sugar phosphate nucleotidyltransferase [Candidatus Deianiraea vastatrix]|uniref:UTP--glucose-1-phosphate uridylyltransferase n=1 Tax=Candidatus Deianiraea vastatrix TaxID=2163644 RepID=A0A5B8XDB0_9RICK|nr:sugar phosphate nucleotidyltransferase [Candidatus Deianiraea vastatrix]QED23312.1 UTP--glucose-1-phosphate uridylyltransferase [Candidatus Deianiraea vastatrix]
MKTKINTVVIPAAGTGSRLDPFTRFLPKELLGINGKPILQIIIDECLEAGIERFIFVTNSKKGLITRDLIKCDKKNVEFIYVIQDESNGLGDAVLRAKSLINDDFFAICLPDEFLFNQNGMKLVVDEFYKNGKNIILTTKEDAQDISKYGVVTGNDVLSSDEKMSIYKAVSVIEKPKNLEESRSSDRCIIGRYVLSRKIFDLLSSGNVGKNGEIQLTDSIASLLKEEDILNIDIKSSRLDCGNYMGFILANAACYIKDENQDFIKKINVILNDGKNTNK